MFKKGLEKSKMSTVEAFCSKTMRDHIAPPQIGSVQARIRHAARKCDMTYTRAKDLWYAHKGARVRGEELARVEQASGVEYARKELRSIDDLIAKADALLDGTDADFHRPFVDAFRAFIGALDRS